MSDPAPALRASSQPLVPAHDLVMFDLDGVVYISGHAVDGAPEAIERAREAGGRMAFVTNNASRTPDQVADHLTELGVPAEPEDVVTSAQAAAHLLAERFDAGSSVLVMGAEGLRQAVREAGLVPVPVDCEGDEADDVVAMVTGYFPDLVWKDMMRAATRIRAGLPWVATNTDMTIPTDDGIAPGHGVLVRLLTEFSGSEPDVAGKPAPPLLTETVRRVGGEHPLMVGDRLDTDIEGATEVDLASLLVLTGVTGLAELVAAPPATRPSFLHPDLTGLVEEHPEVRPGEDGTECGGWTARSDDGALRVEGEGSVADWWRAVAVAGWEHLDRTGSPADHAGLRPPGPEDEESRG